VFLRSQRFGGVDLTDAVFARSDCEGVRFVDVDLRRADFSGALLTGASFILCDLADARFDSAAVTSASFVGCRGMLPETLRALRERGARVWGRVGSGY
jgi:uncharacterized protein YjbI with pentapeptide repeats